MRHMAVDAVLRLHIWLWGCLSKVTSPVAVNYLSDRTGGTITTSVTLTQEKPSFNGPDVFIGNID